MKKTKNKTDMKTELIGKKVIVCGDRGINLDTDEFTVYEFISLTENAYGGEIIKQLIQ